MKIHTSNKEKVKTILDNTTIQGSFWDYTLKYELDNSYLKFDDLIDDDYFNMPEFKWSDWLHEKYVFDVQLNTEDVINGIVIKIRDNGIGIAKDFHVKIFDKLFRIPTGDRHDVKGFGLGLSYVKSIVEKHNGTIKVESQLEKGSTFIIQLEAAKEN